MNIICFSFIIIFTVFLLHEMDAIRVREWKMFIILKDMKEEYAYIFFSIIHLPLYIAGKATGVFTSIYNSRYAFHIAYNYSFWI